MSHPRVDAALAQVCSTAQSVFLESDDLARVCTLIDSVVAVSAGFSEAACSQAYRAVAGVVAVMDDAAQASDASHVAMSLAGFRRLSTIVKKSLKTEWRRRLRGITSTDAPGMFQNGAPSEEDASLRYLLLMRVMVEVVTATMDTTSLKGIKRIERLDKSRILRIMQVRLAHEVKKQIGRIDEDCVKSLVGHVVTLGESIMLTAVRDVAAQFHASRMAPPSCLSCGVSVPPGAASHPRCELCHLAPYCGKQCQQQDWPVHHLECHGC